MQIRVRPLDAWEAVVHNYIGLAQSGSVSGASDHTVRNHTVERIPTYRTGDPCGSALLVHYPMALPKFIACNAKTA